MIFFKTTEKNNSVSHYVLLSWPPIKNDSVTPYGFFKTTDKNDSVTPYVLLMITNKKRQCNPLCFIDDHQ